MTEMFLGSPVPVVSLASPAPEVVLTLRFCPGQAFGSLDPSVDMGQGEGETPLWDLAEDAASVLCHQAVANLQDYLRGRELARMYEREEH